VDLCRRILSALSVLLHAFVLNAWNEACIHGGTSLRCGWGCELYCVQNNITFVGAVDREFLYI